MACVGFKVLIQRSLPGTMSDLVIKSGCAESTIRRWLHRMRKDGECHISGWKRNSGGHTPFYEAGAGADQVCRLRRMSSSDYSKRWRKKMKSMKMYVEVRERDKLKSRTRANADKLAKAGDPMVNALFGR